jgi:hypothetical protein
LCGTHYQKILTKAKSVQANIKKDEFWDHICANFVHMVESIFMSIKAFDGKQPDMGKTWLLMKTFEQHVLLLRNPLFELPSSLVDVIKDQFYQKWRTLMR